MMDEPTAKKHETGEERTKGPAGQKGVFAWLEGYVWVCLLVLIVESALLALLGKFLHPPQRMVMTAVFFSLFLMLLGAIAGSILIARRSRRAELHLEPEERRARRTEARRRVGQWVRHAVIGVLTAGAALAAFYGAIYVCSEYNLDTAWESTWKAKTEAWQNERDMVACKQNLQADLEELWGPEKDPSVTKCTGQLQKAVCLVQFLDSGTYRTLPYRANCSPPPQEGSERNGQVLPEGQG